MQRDSAMCGKSKPNPEGNPESDLPQHPRSTISQPALHHKMSTMKTGSELSEIRNIASLQAHYAFTTQGKSTTTDKGKNRASPSTSSAMNPEAPASARGLPGIERGPAQSRMTRFGNWLFWLTMILLLFFANPTLGQLSLSPELEVHDPSGIYSGQTPLVKTVSLMELY